MTSKHNIFPCFFLGVELLYDKNLSHEHVEFISDMAAIQVFTKHCHLTMAACALYLLPLLHFKHIFQHHHD